jgi:transcriptional/translational regulatory protein YebC/TACO1
MDYAIRDMSEFEDAYEVKTEPSDFYQVKQTLIDHKCLIADAEIKLIAQDKISSLDDDTKQRYEKFVDSCDEDEDIQ